MNMNQNDIEIMASCKHACPNVRQGVRLLHALMLAVNAQSDGWAYWRAPSQAADKLMKLLKTAGNIWYDTHGTITAAELKAAVTPIKAMVTRQKRIQKRYGNTFEFDVDAAMGEIKLGDKVRVNQDRFDGHRGTVTQIYDDGKCEVACNSFKCVIPQDWLERETAK
jgi:hypothetical protein